MKNQDKVALIIAGILAVLVMWFIFSIKDTHAEPARPVQHFTISQNVTWRKSNESFFQTVGRFLQKMGKQIGRDIQRGSYSQKKNLSLSGHLETKSYSCKQCGKSVGVVLENWKQEVAKYICTKKWDCRTAIAVFYAESGFNPEAVSNTHDYGCTQTHNVKEFDCFKSIDLAYDGYYVKGGWRKWSVFKNKSYKQYLGLMDQLNTSISPEINTTQNGY